MYYPMLMRDNVNSNVKSKLMGEQGVFQHRTASEQIELVIKQAILEGRLSPGEVLRQEELAETFNVSRMPVREALKRLEAQALVDFVPYKGAIVTEISKADGLDNYAIRLALEPAAIRYSIPYLSRADLQQATDLIQEMNQETEMDQLGQLNKRFHMCLYGKTPHVRLLQLVEKQLSIEDRYLRFHLSAMGREHMSQDEHLAMVDAAINQDLDRAEEVVRKHLVKAAIELEKFFNRKT